MKREVLIAFGIKGFQLGELLIGVDGTRNGFVQCFILIEIQLNLRT